jgi:hypothetical protein
MGYTGFSIENFCQPFLALESALREPALGTIANGGLLMGQAYAIF